MAELAQQNWAYIAATHPEFKETELKGAGFAYRGGARRRRRRGGERAPLHFARLKTHYRINMGKKIKSFHKRHKPYYYVVGMHMRRNYRLMKRR